MLVTNCATEFHWRFATGSRIDQNSRLNFQNTCWNQDYWMSLQQITANDLETYNCWIKIFTMDHGEQTTSDKDGRNWCGRRPALAGSFPPEAPIKLKQKMKTQHNQEKTTTKRRSQKLESALPRHHDGSWVSNIKLTKLDTIEQRPPVAILAQPPKWATKPYWAARTNN